MPAFKEIENRVVYIDFTNIRLPSHQAIINKTRRDIGKRRMKKIDPYTDIRGKYVLYRTPRELKKACDAYFNSRKTLVYDKFGQPIVNATTGEYITSTMPLTISGLGLAIGIPSNDLRRYRAMAKTGAVKKEFAEVILNALQRIEDYAETMMYDRDGARGGQFILQAGFNWRSKQEDQNIKKTKKETEQIKQKITHNEEEHTEKMRILKNSVESPEDIVEDSLSRSLQELANNLAKMAKDGVEDG